MTTPDFETRLKALQARGRAQAVNVKRRAVQMKIAALADQLGLTRAAVIDLCLARALGEPSPRRTRRWSIGAPVT